MILNHIAGWGATNVSTGLWVLVHKAAAIVIGKAAMHRIFALLLAMVGVYGVLNQATSERMREFGVRIALGAQRGDIVRLVMRQGVTAAAVGIAVGLIGSIGATRLLRDMLYAVTPFDLVSFASASSVMLVTALAACYLPARHATRVDPLESLREG